MVGMELVGGRYILDGRLGEGGMGEVYRVRHAELGKHFALKIISSMFAGDSSLRERFNQEAKLASEISHPNIVSVVDFGEDEKLGAYMVMELVDGAPLMVAEGSRPLTVARATDVLAQVADALDYIHKRGIIHGDVKAENILLVAEAAGISGTRRRTIVRLLDFGLARRHGTEETEVSGSPHYLAPERASGSSASIASDIYALGVLGYALFTGTLPFDGALVDILMAHIERTPEPMSARRGEKLDDAIESLIARALAKQPEARHPTAAAFRYELNAVMDMLELGRSRKRASGPISLVSTRASTVDMLFEQSLLPQAVVTLEGAITLANPAFAKLIRHSVDTTIEGQLITNTTLGASVPGIMRSVRDAHVHGKPLEVHVQVGSGIALTLWFTPARLGGEFVHVVARVERVT